jgi:hypothetical protein
MQLSLIVTLRNRDGKSWFERGRGAARQPAAYIHHGISNCRDQNGEYGVAHAKAILEHESQGPTKRCKVPQIIGKECPLLWL